MRVLILSFLCAMTMAATSEAQSRFVYVNGQRLNDQQITMLEYFHCSVIPNGWYWLNIANGAWGYVGNVNVQGYFGDQCYLPANRPAQQRRQSLSERGMLYSPGEILRGSY